LYNEEDMAVNKSTNIYSYLVEAGASLFGASSSPAVKGTGDAQTKFVGSLHEVVARAVKQRTLLANEMRDFGVGLPPLEHSRF
jgi:hypothetical protein